MTRPVRDKATLKVAIMLALLLLSAQAASQETPGSKAGKHNPQATAPGQIQIPNRSPVPLFKGKQGKQRTEISYDPTTRIVTLKLLVQDPSGYFVPNIRRDNFVVYENGVRQQIVTAEVEHAPVTLAMLLEFGGHAQGFNRELSQEVSRAAEQFLEELGKDDKLAIWKYNDKVEKAVDFSMGHDSLDSFLLTLGTPPVSETNLYDAAIFATEQMRPVAGRKAIILISSGVDTFSKAHYQDALQAVAEAGTPIYAVGLTKILRQIAEVEYGTGPVAKIDWARAQTELEGIAAASGGRTYFPENAIDLTPIYDDMMENLRVRYVISYKSSTELDPNTPRSVRVALVDPATGGPLQIIDMSGKKIPVSVIVQDSYIPSKSTTTLHRAPDSASGMRPMSSYLR